MGAVYDVETSTNLLDWQWLRRVTNDSGTLLFLDPTATNYPNRFYRGAPQ